MNLVPLKVTRIEFCATDLDGYLIARMTPERDECDGTGCAVGQASDVSLTITDAMDRMRVLEPICAPISAGMLDTVLPGGTLVFRQVVPWDGKGVGGLPMNGVVRLQAEAKLVSWSDGVRKPVCAACTESFSLDIGGP
jgi:hypothetical protein